MNPLITVIIPCYNYGRYLPELVRSLEQQTFKNFEVLMYETGSTDGVTPTLFQAIVSDRISLRKFQYPFRWSAAEARMQGIHEAKGRYCVFLDADDYFIPSYLEVATTILEFTDSELICGDTQLFSDGTAPDYVHSSTEFWRTEGPAVDKIFEYNTTPVSAVFRRDFALENELKMSSAKQLAEDWDFWCQAASHGIRYQKLRGATHLYRVHPNSATHSWSPEDWKKGLAEIADKYAPIRMSDEKMKDLRFRQRRENSVPSSERIRTLAENNREPIKPDLKQILVLRNISDLNPLDRQALAEEIERTVLCENEPNSLATESEFAIRKSAHAYYDLSLLESEHQHHFLDYLSIRFDTGAVYKSAVGFSERTPN